MKIEYGALLLIAVFCLGAAVGNQASGEILETWESQPTTNDPFDGNGDLTWTGDIASYRVATETWPTSPAEDFAGDKSLRSQNHPADSVETVVTNITSAVDLGNPMEWSVFLSGNSTTIQPSRRADFVLLSDTSDVADIEDPGTVNGVNGYKLTLWDPYSAAASNTPPTSHEAAGGHPDSVSLWTVDDTDDRWRVVGFVGLGATDNLRDGWNLRVRRETDGEWLIGFANGAIGQTPSLTSLGVDTTADFSGATSFYGGIGWRAPTTDSDNTGFGFDNFSVSSISLPEPSACLLALLGLVGLLSARMRRRRC